MRFNGFLVELLRYELTASSATLINQGNMSGNQQINGCESRFGQELAARRTAFAGEQWFLVFCEVRFIFFLGSFVFFCLRSIPLHLPFIFFHLPFILFRYGFIFVPYSFIFWLLNCIIFRDVLVYLHNSFSYFWFLYVNFQPKTYFCLTRDRKSLYISCKERIHTSDCMESFE